MRKASPRASCQGRIGLRPASDQAPWDSTEYDGRGAGRTNWSLVVGETRPGSSPASTPTLTSGAGAAPIEPTLASAADAEPAEPAEPTEASAADPDLEAVS